MKKLIIVAIIAACFASFFVAGAKAGGEGLKSARTAQIERALAD